MQVYNSLSDFEKFRQSIGENKKVGFVPTMGALHNGHLSLFKQSISDNDSTIGSIFVNPTQFDNPDDYDKYPNRVNQDIKMLEEIGVDALWLPSVEDLYPNGTELDAIDLGDLAKPMEGEFREGHFEGMATVVNRLFKAVRPDRAYFGEKDFQQLQIIRRLNDEMSYEIEIVGMPIIREDNGLAMSSRNLRLSEQEKEDATVIYKTLQQINSAAKNASPEELKNIAKSNFDNSALDLEYIEIREEDGLKNVDHFEKNKNYRAFIAAYIGDIRLIDNQEIKL